MVRSRTMSAATAPARTAAPAGALRRGAVQLARFGSNPLAYVDSLRGVEGEIVSARLGSQVCHLVRAPELVKAVLLDERWPPLSRGRLMGLDKWYSGGLILTEGAEHHRQRDQLWKPLLAEPAGPAIAVDRAGAWADSWTDGQTIELFGEFRDLVWSIDWQTLTGEDMPPELLRAQAAGIAALEWLLGPFGPRRWGAPTPASSRTRAARRRLDAAIAELIAARRAQPADDLLSRLVAAPSPTTPWSRPRSSSGSAPTSCTACSPGRCTCWPSTPTSRAPGTPSSTPPWAARRPRPTSPRCR